MPRGAEFPVHLEIARQILPTVAGPDIPNGSPRKSFVAPMTRCTPRARRGAGGCRRFGAPTGVARALARNVWGQQRVEPQLAAQRLIEHFELGLHEHPPSDADSARMCLKSAGSAPWAPIGDSGRKRQSRSGYSSRCSRSRFSSWQNVSPSVIEKLEIARVRLVHARVVDFVDDPMAEP